MKTTLLTMASVILIVCSTAARAQNAAPTEKKADAGVVELLKTALGPGEFSQAEKEAVQKYYESEEAKEKAESGSKGKGKKKKRRWRLPFGLRKKVERGGELPPGRQKKVGKGDILDEKVFKEAKPIPTQLADVLPEAPPETATVKVENKVIRVIEATRQILDVFDIGTKTTTEDAK